MNPEVGLAFLLMALRTNGARDTMTDEVNLTTANSRDTGGAAHPAAASIADRVALLDLLAEHTRDVVTIYGDEGLILWASRSWQTMLGIDPETVVGTVRPVTHPEDRDHALALFREAVADHRDAFKNRTRLVRADGEVLWADGTITLIWREDGTLSHSIATLHDVTDQVRAEHRLADSERRFRLLAENAADVVIKVAEDRSIEWVSPSSASALGWRPEEMIARRTIDYVHPDDRDRFRTVTSAWQQSGDPGRVTARFRRSDGNYRWFEDISSPITEPETERVMGRVVHLRDVDAEVGATAALAASEELFRRAMTDSGAGMCLVAADGTFLRVNRALCVFFGYEEAELKTKTWQQLTHPEDLDTDTALADRVLNGEMDSYRLAKRYLRADGGVVVGDLTVSGIRSSDGTLLRFVAQIIDITQQTRITQALEESEEHFRLLADHTSDVVARASPDGRMLWVSHSVEAATGWAPEELIGRAFVDFVHPDDVAPVTEAQLQLGEGRPAKLECRILDPHGEPHWFSINANPVPAPDGLMRGRVSSWRKIDAEVDARLLAAEREAEFRMLAENASDLVMRVGEDGGIEWVSPSVERSLGWTTDELMGRSPMEFVHPSDLEEFLADLRSLSPGEPIRRSALIRCADGEYRWFAAMSTAITDEAGAPAGRVIGMRSVDAEMRAMDAMALSEERFRTAMVAAPGGMAVVSTSRAFMQVNAALASLVGHDEPWLLHHRIGNILHVDDDEADSKVRQDLLNGVIDTAEKECRLVRADGTIVWVQHSIGLLPEVEGRERAFVSQFIDISDARAAREGLEFLATHDSLTHALNRRAIEDLLGRITAHPPRTGGHVGVLFLDLDGLKAVNDTFGHAAGDALISAVADRIRGAARSDDAVARLGGDEFLVVLPSIHAHSDVQLVAEEIRRAIAEPIPVGSTEVTVTASIGATVAQTGESPAEVIERADRAVYNAKDGGGNRTEVVDT